MMWRTVTPNRRRIRKMWPGASIWQEMNRLQREMDHLLGGVTASRAAGYPALNVWENEEGIVISAELPGISPEEIEISVVGETLTLSGQRQAEELPEDVKFHRRERGFGAFNRTLELPFRIDDGKVEARFHNGILVVTLPRAVEDQPKKIAIKAG